MDIRYHIDDKKIMKGNSFIIRLGINIIVSKNGKVIFSFKSLKNSISSNKFNVISRQIKN